MDLPKRWLESSAESCLSVQEPRGAQEAHSQLCAGEEQAGAPVLATVCRQENTVVLRFRKCIEGEPFTKMLILGAVLIASN